MGTIILKPQQDEDAYVLWSTGTDGPWFLGTRAEVLEELVENDQRKEQYARPAHEERLQRVDERGTSELIGGPYSWEDDFTLIYMQRGTVHRSDVGKLSEELMAREPGWEERIAAMIEPFEDEDLREKYFTGDPEGHKVIDFSGTQEKRAPMYGSRDEDGI